MLLFLFAQRYTATSSCKRNKYKISSLFIIRANIFIIMPQRRQKKKRKKYSKMHKKKGWDIFLDRLEDAITKITIKCKKIEDFIVEKLQWVGKKFFRIADLTFLAFFVLTVL